MTMEVFHVPSLRILPEIVLGRLCRTLCGSVVDVKPLYILIVVIDRVSDVTQRLTVSEKEPEFRWDPLLLFYQLWAKVARRVTHLTVC